MFYYSFLQEKRDKSCSIRMITLIILHYTYIIYSLDFVQIATPPLISFFVIAPTIINTYMRVRKPSFKFKLFWQATAINSSSKATEPKIRSSAGKSKEHYPSSVWNITFLGVYRIADVTHSILTM